MPLPRLKTLKRKCNEKKKTKKKEPYISSSLSLSSWTNNNNNQHHQRKVEDKNILSPLRNKTHSDSKNSQSSQSKDDGDREAKENVLLSTKNENTFQKNVSTSLPVLSSAFTIQSTDHTINDHIANCKHTSICDSDKSRQHKLASKKDNSKLDSNCLSSLSATTKQHFLPKSPIFLRRQMHETNCTIFVPEVLSCQVKELPDMTPSQTIDVRIVLFENKK